MPDPAVRQADPAPPLVERARRGSVFLMAVVAQAGREATRHRVRDISSGGVRIDNAAGLHPGMTITMSLGALHAIDATVRWARDGLAGVAFAEPIDPEDARRKPTAPPAATGRASPAAPDKVATGWIGNMWDPYRR